MIRFSANGSNFCLDEKAGRLSRDGAALHLTPKEWELFVYLVSRRGDLISKDDIQVKVWPDVIVTEGTVHRTVSKLRDVLGGPAAASIIETTHGRGYKFVPEISSTEPWIMAREGARESTASAAIGNPPARPAEIADRVTRSHPPRTIPSPIVPSRLQEEGWLLTVSVDVNGVQYAIDDLARRVFDYRRVVLLGKGGAGKTIAAWRLLSQLQKRDVASVFVGRDAWTRELGESLLHVDEGGPVHDWRNALDILLRGATTDVTAGDLEALAAHRNVLIVVDGINNGTAPVAARVLDVLNEVLRRLPSTAAVVTDRTDIRFPDEGIWTVARLQDLEEGLVAQRIDNRHGPGTWNAIGHSSRRLLLSPFFLDLALRGAALSSSSRLDSLRTFVARHVRLAPEAIGEIAAATAQAYAGNGRLLQSAALAPATQKALLESGIVDVADASASRLAFTHDLFSDYFAALHLARDFGDLESTGLDAISFSSDRWRFEGLSADTESFDAVTLAAGLIPRRANGDAYLEAVYDWNWRAAVDCLAATDPVDGPFSEATRIVVIALLSERLGDPVDGTRQRAIRMLARLPDRPARALAAAPASASQEIVNTYDFAVKWFQHWKTVFCRADGQPWTVQEIDEIAATNRLHGWTVSYALKRASLNSASCQRLQGMYRGLMVGASPHPNIQSSIRWRIVHALAVGDDEAVLPFLLSVLDNDPYGWVRWGAARSITEFAARAQREELTRHALDALSARADTLTESIRRQIAWTSQYHGASTHFSRAMRPLLLKLRSISEGETARLEWVDRLTRFDEFWTKGVPQ